MAQHTFAKCILSDKCMPMAGDDRLAAYDMNALLIGVALRLVIGGQLQLLNAQQRIALIDSYKQHASR